MAKKDKDNVSMVESVLDLNASNIWMVDEYQIAQLWEEEKMEDGFTLSEAKLLNIIRLAFDVVHYDHRNDRDVAKYENGEWATFSHANEEEKGFVAIRRKQISRISDLSYENVKHISAATLLELIDRNFGGGWDAIPLSIKDIIESGFDISTTQLPASRIHAAGGTVERKAAQGYEILEITKGTWIEAIFAKKKELVDKTRFAMDDELDGRTEDDLNDEGIIDDEESDKNDNLNEEEFYSAYINEADQKDEDEEGFPLDNIDE